MLLLIKSSSKGRFSPSAFIRTSLCAQVFKRVFGQNSLFTFKNLGDKSLLLKVSLPVAENPQDEASAKVIEESSLIIGVSAVTPVCILKYFADSELKRAFVNTSVPFVSK